jgi:acetyltransferase-like isoleucine patch superfamily enzyme
MYSDFYSQVRSKYLILGFCFRLFLFYKYWFYRRVAIFRGASIGADSFVCLKLALKANSNLEIGSNCIVDTSLVDLRSRVKIGNSVLINKNVKILRASHDYNSKLFRLVKNDLIIKDNVWLAENSVILPNCKLVEDACILGSYSIATKDLEEKFTVYVGYPCKPISKRKVDFNNFPLLSMIGGDFRTRYFLRN